MLLTSLSIPPGAFTPLAFASRSFSCATDPRNLTRSAAAHSSPLGTDAPADSRYCEGRSACLDCAATAQDRGGLASRYLVRHLAKFRPEAKDALISLYRTMLNSCLEKNSYPNTNYNPIHRLFTPISNRYDRSKGFGCYFVD